MRTYWNPNVKNFGDVLTPVILGHLGFRPRCVDRGERDKVLAIGSVMNALRPGDTVWGTGVQHDRRYTATTATFLAVRGPITRSCIDGATVPQVYGDPALLLPEVYDPRVEVRHRIGVMPHFVDAKPAQRRYPDALYINVKGGWRAVVRQMKSCERIITTSLHGVIAADAYGIPVTWHASYTDAIVSTNLKFQDHFLATGRPCLPPGPVPPLDRDLWRHLCEQLKRAAAGLPS
jgi:pyruvyltransferase